MNIREERLKLGLTARGLCEKAGISLSTLANIENGLPVSQRSIKMVERALEQLQSPLDSDGLRSWRAMEEILRRVTILENQVAHLANELEELADQV